MLLAPDRGGTNAAETLALIERNRGGGELCPFDAADPTACEQAVARAIETHRRVDILVNNAGIRHDALENHLHSARWLAHR